MADEEYFMATKEDDWSEVIEDLERTTDRLDELLRRDDVHYEFKEAYHLARAAYLRLEGAFKAHKNEIY